MEPRTSDIRFVPPPLWQMNPPKESLIPISVAYELDVGSIGNYNYHNVVSVPNSDPQTRSACR